MEPNVQLLKALVFFSESGKINKAHSYEIQLVNLPDESDESLTKCKFSIGNTYKMLEGIIREGEFIAHDGISFYFDEIFKELHPELTRITYSLYDKDKDNYLPFNEVPALYSIEDLINENTIEPSSIDATHPGLKK